MPQEFQQGRRRNMDRFRLGEVSFVDEPAQEGAVAEVTKSQGSEAPAGISLADFEDVDKMLGVEDDRFSDAEWEAVKSWQYPAILEGESRSEYLKRVMAAPAVEDVDPETVAAIGSMIFEADIAEKTGSPRPGENFRAFYRRMRDADPEMTEEAAKEAFDKSASEENLAKRGDLVDMFSGSEDGHQHGLSILDYGDGIGIMVQYASSEGGEMHDHQITLNADGSYTMSENRGHTHSVDGNALQQAVFARLNKSVAELAKTDASAAAERGRLARAGIAMPDGRIPIRNATDLVGALDALGKAEGSEREAVAAHIEKRATVLDVKDHLPEEGTLADLLKMAEQSGGSVGEGENSMPEDKTELDALKAANERLTAIVGLNAVQKAHFDTLDEDGQNDFLKADADGRDDLMKAAKEAAEDKDPVVYKAANGTEYRKSDDPRLVEMAKERDDDKREAIKLRNAAADADLEKRAEALKSLPGTLQTRKAILKAVDSIEDDETRKDAMASLAAKNAAMSGALVEVGTSETPVVAKAKSEADDELDRLAKARAEAEGEDYFTAYDEVSKANPQLLAKAVG